MARKKRKLASQNSAEDDVNLTPMLDVVFILLIFFIVTAQFIKEPGVEIERTEVDNLDKQNPLGILIAIGYALAVLYGLFLLLRFAVRREVSATDATLIFLWLNIMYVSVIGNAFEVDENQRFRFSVNPFIAATLAVMAARALDWLRGRGRSKKPEPL